MSQKLRITAAIQLVFVCFQTQVTIADEPRYDGTWESLQKMPVPTWFDDGKIGIFIHWGPYSAIGYRKGGRGDAEHVPKLLYADPKHHYDLLHFS